MKKFKFRLEKVLEFRESVTRECKGQLLAANQALTEAESTLKRLISNWDSAHVPQSSILESGEYLLRAAYTARMQREIELQRVTVEEKQTLQAEAMARFVQASQEEKALIRLKDRRRAEFELALQRHEDQTMDELSTQRGNRMERYEQE
jgi:flagellar FliJ protein